MFSTLGFFSKFAAIARELLKVKLNMNKVNKSEGRVNNYLKLTFLEDLHFL